ncbi:hypothetical protein RGUI_3597 [Rhodovulum sp. P5]|nr:hypothetical protein RGUI_3597 [Rhodovulum sp. P5]
MGASGTGTSTLARVLATRLASQAFDTDDFYWRPTDPPFRKKRTRDERIALMQEVFAPRSDWVLAGSLVGWGDAMIQRFTHVVYLTLPHTARRTRLHHREHRRHGNAILPGGALEDNHRAFLDYAMSYDRPEFTGRSRLMHESWLHELHCPVTRLDASPPPDELADRVIERLDRTAGAA